MATSMLTNEGITALANATTNGTPVRPVQFIVTTQNLPLDPTLVRSDITEWYAKDIDRHLIVNNDTAELTCIIDVVDAADVAAFYGLLLEDGTLFMIVRPEAPIPANIRSVLETQVRYENIENALDLTFIPHDYTTLEMGLMNTSAVLGNLITSLSGRFNDLLSRVSSIYDRLEYVFNKTEADKIVTDGKLDTLDKRTNSLPLSLLNTSSVLGNLITVINTRLTSVTGQISAIFDRVEYISNKTEADKIVVDGTLDTLLERTSDLSNTIHREMGKTIYINVLTGKDYNAGTSDKPIRTLEHALTLIPVSGVLHLYLKSDLTLYSDENISLEHMHLYTKNEPGDDFTINLIYNEDTSIDPQPSVLWLYSSTWINSCKINILNQRTNTGAPSNVPAVYVNINSRLDMYSPPAMDNVIIDINANSMLAHVASARLSLVGVMTINIAATSELAELIYGSIFLSHGVFNINPEDHLVGDIGLNPGDTSQSIGNLP